MQLTGLVTIVEGYRKNLLRCTLQEAGTQTKGFIPSIKVSLQSMLQSLSSSKRAKTSQLGSSKIDPLQLGLLHYRVV